MGMKFKNTKPSTDDYVKGLEDQNERLLERLEHIEGLLERYVDMSASERFMSSEMCRMCITSLDELPRYAQKNSWGGKLPFSVIRKKKEYWRRYRLCGFGNSGYAGRIALYERVPGFRNNSLPTEDEVD